MSTVNGGFTDKHHTSLQSKKRNQGMGKWVKSKFKDDLGDMEVSSRKNADPDAHKGLKTKDDGKFYHYSAPFDKTFETKGKNIVVQFSLQHEQDIKCGGGYVKLLLENEPEKFNGETPYGIMFGPDLCGNAKKIHLIISHNGKNILKTKEISFTKDKLIHVYSLHILPDKTYEVYVDDKKRDSGKIEDEWILFGEKLIDDPDHVKPEDYDENRMIVDLNAKKPEDWDDEKMGEWEPPKIENPDFEEFTRRKIENPDYKHDPNHTEYKFVGIGVDVWQVESGSIFSDFLITDDIEHALVVRNELLSAYEKINSSIQEAIDKELEKEKANDDEEDEDDDGDDDDDDINDDDDGAKDDHDEL